MSKTVPHVVLEASEARLEQKRWLMDAGKRIAGLLSAGVTLVLGLGCDGGCDPGGPGCAVAGAAGVRIELYAGDQQTGEPGASVATPPAVRALDARGRPVSGLAIRFEVTSGAGSIRPASPATVLTDVDGVAAIAGWSLGPDLGVNTVSARAPGLRHAPVGFTAMGLVEFVQLSEGHSHSCGISSSGRAYCWGQNAHGQLGDGTTTDSRTPIRVKGDIRFAAVSVSTPRGTDLTCGVAVDRRLFCWGLNSFGQAGRDSQAYSKMPVRIGSDLRFQSVFVGAFHACGLGDDRHAYCWGNNLLGQLGLDAGEQSSTPLLASGAQEFRELEGGPFETCGYATNGARYCWGFNTDRSWDWAQAVGVRRLESHALPDVVATALAERSQLAAAGASTTCQAGRKSADLNGDGLVNITDLIDLIIDWKKSDSPADVNKDGVVDIHDLIAMIIQWTGSKGPPILEVLDGGSPVNVLDFGDGATPPSREVMVRNVGESMLCVRLTFLPGWASHSSIPAFRVNGATLVVGLDMELPPGIEHVLTVVFDPTSSSGLEEGAWKSSLNIRSDGGTRRVPVVGEVFGDPQNCWPFDINLPPNSADDKCSVFARLLSQHYLGLEHAGVMLRAITLADVLVVPTRTELWGYMEACLKEVLGFCVERRRESLLALASIVDLGTDAHNVASRRSECLTSRAHESLQQASMFLRVFEFLQLLQPSDFLQFYLDYYVNPAARAAIAGIARIDCSLRSHNEQDVLAEYFGLRDQGTSQQQSWQYLLDWTLVATLMQQWRVTTAETMQDALEFLWRSYRYSSEAEPRYRDGDRIGVCAADNATRALNQGAGFCASAALGSGHWSSP